ncbi:MAG: P1 family peptidase [Armatimonadetes bacterium]|nr:P1 family peptidase [Armatimonadota bacterium]
MTGTGFPPGVLVGHATDREGVTGCTVVMVPQGAVGGVDVRGGAPGTRDTDLLRPGHLVETVHAVMLTGGSIFGLAAVDGAMRYLEEQGVGHDVGVARVPIVPAAVIFDLSIGDSRARPTAAMGYAACMAAKPGGMEEGSVGAGTGATVGKLYGVQWATKGGIGAAGIGVPGGAVVAAVAVVNAFGDVVDEHTGAVLAGCREPRTGKFAGIARVLRTREVPPIRFGRGAVENTTIGVVVTNARLTKEQANRLASLAHNGLARAVSPPHTMVDGDTFFVLATGEVEANFFAVGVAAEEAVAEAIRRAVLRAESLGGVPACRDLPGAGAS